jgi:excisionase family DNA binding protein
MSPRRLASEPAIDSPYLTAREASQYLRYASVAAFYQAITANRIPVRHRGRSLLFHRDDLDQWLAGKSRVELGREARKHGKTVTPIALARSPKTDGTTR